jgi:hypothetical protein
MLFGLMTHAFKTPLYLIKALPGLGERLVGGPFFGGQWGANGFAEFMLDMEQIGRVMRPQMVFDIGQKPRRFITGGLNDLTVELGQGGCHQVIPDLLITGLSELFQNNKVAHRLSGHQAQTAGEGFVLSYGDGFAGHVLGQAHGFRLLILNDGLFDLAVDLLLSPIGGGDKSVQTQ